MVRSLSQMANPKLTSVCRMHTTKSEREIYQVKRKYQTGEKNPTTTLRKRNEIERQIFLR